MGKGLVPIGVVSAVFQEVEGGLYHPALTGRKIQLDFLRLQESAFVQSDLR